MEKGKETARKEYILRESQKGKKIRRVTRAANETKALSRDP